MKSHFSVFRLLICLLLCCSLIFSCLHVKVEAFAIEGFLGVGIAALLILFAAGVVIQVSSQADVEAIGQSFQSHMFQWGTEANKLDEVEDWFNGLSIVPGSGGDDPRPEVNIARGILAGITLWVSSIILGTIKIGDPDAETTPQGYIGYSGLTLERKLLYILANNLNACDFPFWDFLKLAHDNELAMITICNSSDLMGFYFDEYGLLKFGRWENPSNQALAKNCTMYPLTSLTLLDSYYSSSLYVFGSKTAAQQYPDYSSINVLVIDWENIGSTVSSSSYNYIDILGDYKKAGDEVFTTSGIYQFQYSYTGVVGGIFNGTGYQMHMSSWSGISEDGSFILPEKFVGDVAEGVLSGELGSEDITVPDIDYSLIYPGGVGALEGVQNIGQMMIRGDLTVDEYLEMIQPGSSAAARPTLVSSIPHGSSVTYYKGQTAAPITVLATAADGGTLTYEWYRWGTDVNGKLYPVEVLDTSNAFVPSTSEAGTANYYCRVINTSPAGMVSFVHTGSIQVVVLNEDGTSIGSDANADLADKIGSAVGDAVNDALNDSLGNTLQDALAQSQTQQDGAAQQQGNDAANQLINLIPDYSADFLPSVRNLASSLGYEGTSCVLTMPAITVPAVGSLFPQTTLLGEQTINFEDYFNKMPETIMAIVRALFDIAVVFFCLREVSDLIQRALTGFKDRKEDNND